MVVVATNGVWCSAPSTSPDIIQIFVWEQKWWGSEVSCHPAGQKRQNRGCSNLCLLIVLHWLIPSKEWYQSCVSSAYQLHQGFQGFWPPITRFESESLQNVWKPCRRSPSGILSFTWTQRKCLLPTSHPCFPFVGTDPTWLDDSGIGVPPLRSFTCASPTVAPVLQPSRLRISSCIPKKPRLGSKYCSVWSSTIESGFQTRTSDFPNVIFTYSCCLLGSYLMDSTVPGNIFLGCSWTKTRCTFKHKHGGNKNWFTWVGEKKIQNGSQRIAEAAGEIC